MTAIPARSRFLLVPNHSVERDRAELRIESAEAQLLQKLGADFSQIGIAAFVSSRRGAVLTGTIDGRVEVHRLNVLGDVGLRAGKLLNYVCAAIRLPAIVARHDFIYIFCPGHCALLAAFWARLLGKPYGFYVRGTWLDAKGDTPLWWRPLFRGASFMVVTGEAFRRRLLRYCANVVNEVPLTALHPRQIANRQRPMSSPVRLMFAGRMTESKGILDVVTSVALLREEGRHVELVVAGGSTAEEQRKLDDAVSRLGLHDAVRMLGHVPPGELAAAYEAADIFVFPSYFAEGFPRVLYEAMMFSAAIVTAEMPGIRDFLVDEQNCLYCAIRNPHDVARQVRRLIDEPQLAKRLGERSRTDVLRLYESFTEPSHAAQVRRWTCVA